MVQNRVGFFAGAFLLVLSLSGCSAMQPVDSSATRLDILKEIEAGDQIEIKTKSGEIRSILVSSISDTHIIAGNEQFLIGEIEIISHRKLNALEEGSAVALGLAVAALLHALTMAVLLALAF